MRASFESLKKTHGNILAISATLHYSSTPWQLHASAAKAGVDSLIKSIAAEWGEFGIRANAIAPGPIKATEGFRKLSLGLDNGGALTEDQQKRNMEQVEQMVSEKVPLRRCGEVTDIGRSAVFLSSDETAAYVTGEVLVVDGGNWLFHEKAISREMLLEGNKQRKSKL